MEWWPEWLQACSSGCVLLAGWFATNPSDVELHALRKHLKEVRDGLESLRHGMQEASLERWIHDLRRTQSCLGDLHDQQVMMELLRRPKGSDAIPSGATWHRRLEEQHQDCWQQWLALRPTCCSRRGTGPFTGWRTPWRPSRRRLAIEAQAEDAQPHGAAPSEPVHGEAFLAAKAPPASA